jgi:hypothetical protein
LRVWKWGWENLNRREIAKSFRIGEVSVFVLADSPKPINAPTIAKYP